MVVGIIIWFVVGLFMLIILNKFDEEWRNGFWWVLTCLLFSPIILVVMLIYNIIKLLVEIFSESEES